MFNAISKFMNPGEFMSDGKEIAKKVSSINKFEELTRVSYLNEVHKNSIKERFPTMDDLYLGIMRAQSSIVSQVKESDKVDACIRIIQIINEFMNCVDLDHIKVNRLCSIVRTIDNIAVYIAMHGTETQKEEVIKVYNRVLDAAIEYHDHVCNVRWLMDIISEIKDTKKEIVKK